jgi:hypothetical protein
MKGRLWKIKDVLSRIDVLEAEAARMAIEELLGQIRGRYICRIDLADFDAFITEHRERPL